MERVRFITYQGVRILHLDLSGIEDLAELVREAERASRLIRGEPPGSVLVLVDLTGVPYSLRAVRALGEIAAENVAYVKARAVVGLRTLVRPTVLAVAQYTRKPVEAFDHLEPAMEWLAERA